MVGLRVGSTVGPFVGEDVVGEYVVGECVDGEFVVGADVDGMGKCFIGCDAVSVIKSPIVYKMQHIIYNLLLPLFFLRLF